MQLDTLKLGNMHCRLTLCMCCSWQRRLHDTELCVNLSAALQPCRHAPFTWHGTCKLHGSSHASEQCYGFVQTALTRTMNALGRKTKQLKEGEANLEGTHIREGLSAIISVKVPEPEFEGQTKTRLGNPEVRKILDSVITKVGQRAILDACMS